MFTDFTTYTRITKGRGETDFSVDLDTRKANSLLKFLLL